MMMKVQLARLMKVDEKEVRRILDPRHGTKLSTADAYPEEIDKAIQENKSMLN